MMCLNQSGDLNRQYNFVWVDILVATPIYVVIDIVVHVVFEILCDLVPTRKSQKRLWF